jgi:hypothetical protein
MLMCGVESESNVDACFFDLGSADLWPDVKSLLAKNLGLGGFEKLEEQPGRCVARVLDVDCTWYLSWEHIVGRQGLHVKRTYQEALQVFK